MKNKQNKIRFSLAWKLHIKLFFRLVAFFLILNIALGLASAVWLVLRTEQTITATAALLEQEGLPSAEAENWLTLNGIRVSRPDWSESRTQNAFGGFRIPESIYAALSAQSVPGVRYIDLPNAGKPTATIWEQVENVTYNAIIETESSSYHIAILFQGSLRTFLGMFFGLLALELIMLLTGTLSNILTVRKTLRPIEELARTAQNLNSSAAFTPEQLEALAGKLDHINAAKLDTRIPVDDTQNELKTLASAINGMLDRINQAYRSQARFVSDASHELRTPISVIQGYVNLLDRWGKNDPKTLQESIEAIKDETANMKNMVEQLLFLARGDNNSMAMQIEHFELSDLALEVFRETQMIDEGHEYASQVAPVFINADKSLIKQALRILIDNALKYTPSGKLITISVSTADGLARLTVQDEGIGIAPEAVPLIFERFFRADESRARSTGGTGLGLSIAEWITERHGGHMEVLSRQDIGTRISLVLPAAAEKAESRNSE